MNKPEVFMDLLRAGLARVHLDGRRNGVVLPAELRAEKQVMLDYGYNLPRPITGLDVDVFGIHATLSFSATPKVTFIPWSAIYAITNDRGIGKVWDEDVPEDLEYSRREVNEDAERMAN